MFEWTVLAVKQRGEKNKKAKRSLAFLSAVRTGLEPATPGVTGRYSNQLNYRTSVFIGVANIERIDNKTNLISTFGAPKERGVERAQRNP